MAASIAGCAPCYLKSHSQGEYVFDHGWAEAFEQAGGHYYPKLQIAVPFTPVPGRRLLVRPGRCRGHEARACRRPPPRSRNATTYRACTSRSSAKANGAGSASAGFLQRTDQQFHWSNAGYAHLRRLPGLARLAQAQGHAQGARARRSRRASPSNGSRGRDITEAHWDAFFAFYMDTGSRKWGRPYLNRKFFSLLGAAMGERCLLMHGQARQPRDRRLAAT